MVAIYQKNNTTDTKKESRNKQFRLSQKFSLLINDVTFSENNIFLCADIQMGIKI